jgi:glucose/arabinose dehydrogenase
MRTILYTYLLIFCMGSAVSQNSLPFEIERIASFNGPWAMTFLPDGDILVTEKSGRLLMMDHDGGNMIEVTGVPSVAYDGQGGLGDVTLHPDYAKNKMLYLSFAEAEEGDKDKKGAAVIRAKLNIINNTAELSEVKYIWRQIPKVTGSGHYGHRIEFSSDGFLYISSGDRQKFDPAQDMAMNLGKILRLYDDGTIPEDNPFFADGGVAAQVWSLGHRNPLGFDFDANGQLWETEMGPKGGDELNRVIKGKNYGYPLVSNGRHYNMREIPDHHTRPEFEAPKEWWTPVISPSSFVIYHGDLFSDWKGDGFISGLSSKSLVHVRFSGSSAAEIERFDMGKRIRSVEEGPNGALWLLEDKKGARLLKLTPKP